MVGEQLSKFVEYKKTQELQKQQERQKFYTQAQSEADESLAITNTDIFQKKIDELLVAIESKSSDLDTKINEVKAFLALTENQTFYPQYLEKLQTTALSYNTPDGAGAIMFAFLPMVISFDELQNNRGLTGLLEIYQLLTKQETIAGARTTLQQSSTSYLNPALDPKEANNMTYRPLFESRVGTGKATVQRFTSSSGSISPSKKNSFYDKVVAADKIGDVGIRANLDLGHLQAQALASAKVGDAVEFLFDNQGKPLDIKVGDLSINAGYQYSNVNPTDKLKLGTTMSARARGGRRVDRDPTNLLNERSINILPTPGAVTQGSGERGFGVDLQYNNNTKHDETTLKASIGKGDRNLNAPGLSGLDKTGVLIGSREVNRNDQIVFKGRIIAGEIGGSDYKNRSAKASYSPDGCNRNEGLTFSAKASQLTYGSIRNQKSYGVEGSYYKEHQSNHRTTGIIASGEINTSETLGIPSGGYNLNLAGVYINPKGHQAALNLGLQHTKGLSTTKTKPLVAMTFKLNAAALIPEKK